MGYCSLEESASKPRVAKALGAQSRLKLGDELLGRSRCEPVMSIGDHLVGDGHKLRRAVVGKSDFAREP